MQYERAEYDAAQPLVIDPTLVYGTFLGGNSTDAAHAILRSLGSIGDTVFPLTPGAMRLAWDRACGRAGLINLRFHDLRHEATSRLFEKGLNVLEVATITGHKNLKHLQRYTHLRAEDLAKKLG